MIGLDDLKAAAHPLLLVRYLPLAADYAKVMAPWSLGVTSCLRRDAQQIALFAQGRKPLAIVNELRQKAGMYLLLSSEENIEVTKADGIRVRSNHQGVLVDGVMRSRAIDVVATTDPDGPGPMKTVVSWNDLRLYRPLTALAKRHGLASGGTWKKPDWPHLELAGGD